MWVFRPINDGGGILWSVGFYSPDGWQPESDWSTKEEAARRVNYLNGGTSQWFLNPSEA